MRKCIPTNAHLLLAGLLMLGVLTAGPRPAQATQDALTPEAQAAMDRGFIAAKAEKWQEAIDSFEVARALLVSSNIPLSVHPELLFNLALANDKAPGRYLNAATWYHAYLMVEPNVPNAQQILSRVDHLIQQFDEYVWKLIWMIEDTVVKTGQSVSARLYYSASGNAADAIGYVEAARIYMGDTNTALKKLKTIRWPVVGGMESPAFKKNYHYVIIALTEVGNFDEAKQLLSSWPDKDVNDYDRYFEIVHNYNQVFEDSLQYCQKLYSMSPWFDVLPHSNNRFVRTMATDNPQFVKTLMKKEGDYWFNYHMANARKYNRPIKKEYFKAQAKFHALEYLADALMNLSNGRMIYSKVKTACLRKNE